MITGIEPFNFPESYLSKATFNDAVMGEKTITATVKIDTGTVPDFKGWYVLYNGEKYVLPIRKPQGSVANTSLNASYELTFQHWAVYQLKRFLFAEMAEIGTESVIPDKYEASLGLDLGDFVTAFNSVLDYYFGGQIRMDLNPEMPYTEEKTMVSISISKIWEVLQQLYDLYAVTWYIEPAEDNDNRDGMEKYVIKVGYPAREMEHVFRYGFDGGLLKVERQVQSSDIINVLLGRGGEKNIPYRYFKQTDEDNVSFSPDPDWIPELKDVYMNRLRDIDFRYYVQGWKDAHYYTPSFPMPTAMSSDITINPDLDIIVPHRGPRRYAIGLHPAYDAGYIDEKFDPIEYVKDDMSINEYGELWGCLEDNDDIYPTIQGIGDPETGWGIGRVDQTVAVEQIISDDVAKYAEENATLFNLNDVEGGGGSSNIPSNGLFTNLKAFFYRRHFFVEKAEVDEENAAFLTYDFKTLRAQVTYGNGSGKEPNFNVPVTLIDFRKYASESTADGTIYIDTVKKTGTSQLMGRRWYSPYVEFDVTIDKKYLKDAISVTVICEASSIKWGYQADSSVFQNTFDIWIKDLWHSTRNAGESDADFVKRVWTPILGNKEGETAKVVFSSGWLATSEDYEFEIYGGSDKAAVANGVHYDASKTLEVKDKDGNVTATYQSMWRLTLIKSDADLDSTGLYVPSTRRQGNAGDYFFFTGIDMPHQYVVWAEQRLHNYKVGELDKVSDIKPTWAVTLDKIRIQERQADEVETLISQIKTGGVVRLQDDRMLPAGDTFYIKSLAVEYSSAIYPSLTVTLSDELTVSMSAISTIQGEVDALQKQVGTLANIEALVRIVGDKLYLRKDGQEDQSFSSTTFRNIIKGNDFRQGRLGGSGWAIYRDGKQNTVLEVDRAIIRQSMEVTELVIHQTEYVGGSRVESAAAITCLAVNPVNRDGDGWKIVLDESNPDAYQCYFDTKQGTVRNLFKVDDVAYSQAWDGQNTEIRFYKRRVIEIGEDYIILSNAEEYVNGSSVPAPNDVIIHYGNYTDKDRQYVKVSDVIKGGYDRFIEGLDSVTSDGEEYYFAGREMVSSENLEGYRFFVGNHNGHYMEWKDGELTIRGKLTVDSTVGDQRINDYVNKLVTNVTDGLQQQLDGVVEVWFFDGVPTLANMPAKNWTTTAERENHIGDWYYDNKTGIGYQFGKNSNGIYEWVKTEQNAITMGITTANGKMRVFTSTPYTPYSVGDMWVNAGDKKDIKVCKNARASGNFVESDWGLASDYDSTQTTIDGGIITSGTIRLYGGGKGSADANVKAGITGVGTSDSDVRIWAGSTMGNRASAPFRVTQSGEVYATAANIEGNIVGNGILTPEGGISNVQKETIEGTRPGNPPSSWSYETTNTVRIWCGDSFKNRMYAPFRVLRDGSMYANNVTLEGNIKFTKDIGYITASVQRPFLTITSDNFSTHFNNNKISFDFSYGLIIQSVPSGVEEITIEYSGVINGTTFLLNNYGNTFVVMNNCGVEITYSMQKKFTGYKTSSLVVFQAGSGYMSFTVGAAAAPNNMGTVAIMSPTVEKEIGWHINYASDLKVPVIPF